MIAYIILLMNHAEGYAPWCFHLVQVKTLNNDEHDA